VNTTDSAGSQGRSLTRTAAHPAWQHLPPRLAGSTNQALAWLRHNGRVNAVTVEVRAAGRDRKLYLVSPRSPEALAQIRETEHRLRCRDGLSVRQVQAALASEHGVRRSLGAIMRDLKGWQCEACGG
jgi:hypothetical protein